MVFVGMTAKEELLTLLPKYPWRNTCGKGHFSVFQKLPGKLLVWKLVSFTWDSA